MLSYYIAVSVVVDDLWIEVIIVFDMLILKDKNGYLTN